jgi:hypothetical protein
MLKLCEMDMTASTIIFLRVMIEKKYSLPIRV